jgi:hypothetical protein
MDRAAGGAIPASRRCRGSCQGAACIAETNKLACEVGRARRISVAETSKEGQAIMASRRNTLPHRVGGHI